MICRVYERRRLRGHVESTASGLAQSPSRKLSRTNPQSKLTVANTARVGEVRIQVNHRMNKKIVAAE